MVSPDFAELQHSLTEVSETVHRLERRFAAAESPTEKADIELLLSFFKGAKQNEQNKIELHKLDGKMEQLRYAISDPERYVPPLPPPSLSGSAYYHGSPLSLADAASRPQRDLESAEQRKLQLEGAITRWQDDLPEWGKIIKPALARLGAEYQLSVSEEGTRPPDDQDTKDVSNHGGGVAAPITDRRAAVDAYIVEVFEKTGKRIRRTDIWKMAKYKTRTEFERWQRNDAKNSNKTAHENFTRILTDKPHLK